MEERTELRRMLDGHKPTTGRILYHMPDHSRLLQTYVWQDYDIAPRFPVLGAFLDFWKEKLDGPLHSIAYSHKRLIAASEWRGIEGELAPH